jgi:predicted Co/Zn/Cd cation transporter (cation efflux family)
LGVTWLAWSYRRATRRQPPIARVALDAPRRRLLMTCLATAFVVGATAAWLLTPEAIASRRFVRSLVWCTSSFAALYAIASAAWWRRHGDA